MSCQRRRVTARRMGRRRRRRRRRHTRSSSPPRASKRRCRNRPRRRIFPKRRRARHGPRLRPHRRLHRRATPMNSRRSSSKQTHALDGHRRKSTNRPWPLPLQRRSPRQGQRRHQHLAGWKAEAGPHEDLHLDPQGRRLGAVYRRLGGRRKPLRQGQGDRPGPIDPSWDLQGQHRPPPRPGVCERRRAGRADAGAVAVARSRSEWHAIKGVLRRSAVATSHPLERCDITSCWDPDFMLNCSATCKPPPRCHLPWPGCCLTGARGVRSEGNTGSAIY